MQLLLLWFDCHVINSQKCVSSCFFSSFVSTWHLFVVLPFLHPMNYLWGSALKQMELRSLSSKFMNPSLFEKKKDLLKIYTPTQDDWMTEGKQEMLPQPTQTDRKMFSFVFCFSHSRSHTLYLIITMMVITMRMVLSWTVMVNLLFFFLFEG